MKIKSAKEVSRRYARGSIIAYTGGRKNENWAVGCIQSSGVTKEDLEEIFQFVESLPGYNNSRLKGLRERCQREEFL